MKEALTNERKKKIQKYVNMSRLPMNQQFNIQSMDDL